MSKKAKFKESDLGANPLVSEEFVIKLKKLKSKYILKQTYSQLNVDTSAEQIELQQSITVEQDTYTKVYNKSMCRLYIMDLSPKACKLYLWVIYELDAGKDYLWFNRDRIKKELNISDNTYRAAVKELQMAVIITPSVVKDIYWINPELIFHGSRKDKYPNNVQIIK